MAETPCRSEGTGANGGKSRRSRRAEVKRSAKRKRRENDKKACQGDQ